MICMKFQFPLVLEVCAEEGRNRRLPAHHQESLAGPFGSAVGVDSITLSPFGRWEHRQYNTAIAGLNLRKVVRIVLVSSLASFVSSLFPRLIFCRQGKLICSGPELDLMKRAKGFA